ncbi:MAG: hypothetical protein IJD37_05775 [Clostridia bacterium]|nr:hypothetical protein [Clostridia bacterium]
MKKFAKFLVLALAVAVMASAFALVASAEEPTVIDPNTLVPGSDRVIFIKDAPRDENNEVVGELAGDGTGTDADNPLKPTEDHERFDPTAERKRWHVLTAFYQAVEMLQDTGGTIVICGPVFIGINEVGDNGATSVRDMETVAFKDKVIKFTSVYNGVDYRETAGAKITMKLPAMINLKGSTIWENIDIATDGTDRAICFGDYPTLVGEGINCYPTDEAFEGVAQNYVSLAGGPRYNNSKDKITSLVVKSGTYNKITGGSWGTVATHNIENNTTYLTIEGTTTVLGAISGSVNSKTPWGGHVNITINDGTFECDINGVGATGMTNTDGTVKMTINGGNFKNAWSINQSAMGAANNMPAACSVDFSGWKGDTLGLAYANGVITDITDIKYPAGVTADQLAEALKNAPVDEPETDEPDTAEPGTAETKAPETSAPKTEAPDDEETKAPETSAPVIDDGANEGGSNTTLIIIIVVAVVVVAGVVVGIVLSKKKKK